MDKLKQLYNSTLKRYYNGVNYIETHLDEAEKYLPAVLDLQHRLDVLIEQIGNMTNEEILEGFK